MPLLSLPASNFSPGNLAFSEVEERKPTLLIVDDEEGPRQSIKIIFKRDYNVLIACGGREALALAQENEIQVAILDIMMGDMSGVDLLRELKQNDPSMEIIMLTAYETLDTARQALRHGACDYLNKPFDIPTIRSAVSRAVQKNQLHHSIQDSHQQLETLHKEIENQRLVTEMAQTKGEIYASVLHDINSPLTIISSFIDILNRSISDASTVEGQQLDKFRNDLGKLNTQVNRCVEISRRYLSFLRKGPEKDASSSVNQTLNDLDELLERHPQRMGNDFSVQLLADDLMAAVNGTDFLQILLNLTINALQCSSAPHRVAVSATFQDEPIAFDPGNPCEKLLGDGDAPGPFIRVDVADNGPGIAPAVLSKMFDTSFTTKEAGQGTGLGLTIVKRLLLASGGALHLTSRPSEGTRFTIYLRTPVGRPL